MPIDMTALVSDLADESAELDAVLATLAEPVWRTPTPAVGWTIADQVSHLAFFDEAGLRAATDPDRFRRETAELAAIGPAYPDVVAARYRSMSGGDLLDWQRRARQQLLDAYAAMAPSQRVPWYGPDMSVASAVTARLMETWAHGQDVFEALGLDRQPTNRLRHIAHLGITTMAFSFEVRGRPAPLAPVRVELTGPQGDAWAWGPDGAPDVVRGFALDFCLLVTQRRHRDDVRVTAEGGVAQEWMSIAQAFAGAPGPGRGRMSGDRG